MKLIKLSETHYIVVDDSEIREGDWFVNLFLTKTGIGPYIVKSVKKINDEPYFTYVSSNDLYHLKKHMLKITHSTQPLEGVKPLSLSEVKEFDEQGKLKLI